MHFVSQPASVGYIDDNICLKAGMGEKDDRVKISIIGKSILLF